MFKKMFKKTESAEKRTFAQHIGDIVANVPAQVMSEYIAILFCSVVLLFVFIIYAVLHHRPTGAVLALLLFIAVNTYYSIDKILPFTGGTIETVTGAVVKQTEADMKQHGMSLIVKKDDLYYRFPLRIDKWNYPCGSQICVYYDRNGMKKSSENSMTGTSPVYIELMEEFHEDN